MDSPIHPTPYFRSSSVLGKFLFLFIITSALRHYLLRAHNAATRLHDRIYRREKTEIIHRTSESQRILVHPGAFRWTAVPLLAVVGVSRCFTTPSCPSTSLRNSEFTSSPRVHPLLSDNGLANIEPTCWTSTTL